MAGTQVIGENTLRSRALGDDLLAELSGDGHVGGDVLWRGEGCGCLSEAKVSEQAAGVKISIGSHSCTAGDENLWRHQADRDPVAVITRSRTSR